METTLDDAARFSSYATARFADRNGGLLGFVFVTDFLDLVVTLKARNKSYEMLKKIKTTKQKTQKHVHLSRESTVGPVPRGNWRAVAAVRDGLQMAHGFQRSDYTVRRRAGAAGRTARPAGGGRGSVSCAAARRARTAPVTQR